MIHPPDIQLADIERAVGELVVGDGAGRMLAMRAGHFFGSLTDESTILVAGPKPQSLRDLIITQPVGVNSLFGLQFSLSFLDPGL